MCIFDRSYTLFLKGTSHCTVGGEHSWARGTGVASVTTLEGVCPSILDDDLGVRALGGVEAQYN